MIKNELKKKLGLYSLASGAMAVAAGNAEAQVTYHDVNPDVTVNTAGGSYALDLNGDGTTDFTFNISTGTNKGLYIVPAAGNFVLGTKKGAVYRDTVLVLGDAIPVTPTANNNMWIGSSALMAASNGTSAYGKFAGTNLATDKYIGLKLKVSTGNFIYAWARVGVTISSGQATKIVIRDAGYNATVNSTLTAGQGLGATSVQQSLELTANTQVFVNGQNEVALVNNTDKYLSTQLLDINGNLVATKEVGNGLTLLSADNLAPGMYIVKMTTDDAIASKKVFIR